MIRVTRLNGMELVVNLDFVKSIEATPDTLITLITNERLLVMESVDEVVERAIEYRRRCGPQRLAVAVDKHFPLRLPSGRLWEEVAPPEEVEREVSS